VEEDWVGRTVDESKKSDQKGKDRDEEREGQGNGGFPRGRGTAEEKRRSAL
jgi:hypothetical protein